MYGGETDNGGIWPIDSKTGKHRKLLEDSSSVLYWLPDSGHFLVLKDENDMWLADIEAEKVFKRKTGN